MKQFFPDFGKFLTYEEAVKSSTAIRLGIDNSPTREVYLNMVQTYRQVYEPLCNHFGKKLPVSSFFRCIKLNTAIKGSKTSGHMQGRSIDIDMDIMPVLYNRKRLTNLDVFEAARKVLSFDQLILEAPDLKGIPSWVHISYRDAKTNRRQVLKMTRDQAGNPIYVSI